MNLSSQIGKVIDKLNYNLIYAPDYPPEDRTNFDREEEKIQKGISEATALVKREDVGDWLRLGSGTVTTAFRKFRSGSDGEACKAIESAIEYLQNAQRQKPHKVDFVADADGTVTDAASSGL